jgi:hypothetical protein
MVLAERSLIHQTSRIGNGNNRFVTDMPTIHEDQIFGVSPPGGGVLDYGADVDESYIWGVSGVRGSGKSQTLCYMGIRALALRLPVWSNFPIKYRLLQHHKDPIIVESTPLNFKELFSLSANFFGGLILIDEYQDWANALSFMTTQNKILNGIWAQIRKNQLSFAYGAKKLRWIDLKTREETDIEIGCKDASKTPKGRRLYGKGEKVYWDFKDWSGNWTGKGYEDFPITHPYTFEAKFIWGAFDTNQRFDIFEAMRGLKMDLTKTVISDKEPENDNINREQIEKMMVSIFGREHVIKATEMYDILGLITNKQKSVAARLVKDMGGTEVFKGGCRYFKCNPETDLVE